ncbi:hypothetical protein IFM89_017541 [Coptis chinensis]|uniref:Pectate lyase n=1 Tax=Coptis chinensis TaxID=261450 RepID=A0A835HW72_9MAGN|nr:hypothetical protein IFM89_017541 [Coptis chinensis]
MELLYRIPMVPFMVYILVLVCSSHANVNERCDDMVINVLRNNITRSLYSIERGVKMLMNEEEDVEDGMEKFEEIPYILNQFLLSKYEEVESRLKKLVRPLLMYSGSNLTSSVYIPESIIDFSKQALRNAKHAQSMLPQLIQCNKKITSNGTGRLSDSLRKYGLDRIADGTKCQYRSCAQGNKLPMCAVGFATGVTGGAAGSYYTVTRNDDTNTKNPAPGTLRHAVNYAGKNKGGAWIVFNESMVIKLKEKLWIKSDTTIDGRGANVTIIQKGLVLANVKNVILHNLEVFSTGNSDTVHVFNGSRLVWIDHLTSKDAYLGLVTVLQGSTDVTISNCYLSNHNFNMLLGASDKDTIDQNLRVTVYRNWFESSNQRMPHCRWGYCHVANNYYRDWHYYAIGGRVHAKILSDKNVFEPGARLEVTPWHPHFTADLTPTIESSEDLLLEGATFHEFLSYGTLTTPETEFPNYRLPLRPTITLASLVTKCSGVLFGQKLRDCKATP